MAHYDDNASDYYTMPEWIEDSITLGDIPEIATHGCASGAYMPAVTYYCARRSMWQHGDQIIDFINEYSDISCAEVLQNADADKDYSLMCCALVSFAVELWCHNRSEGALELINSEDDDEGVAA